MGQHGPETAQRFRRHARPELRNVAFEVRAHEVLSPHCARFVALGEKAVRESAPDPEALARVSTALATAVGFENVERLQLDVGDAAGQGLPRLPEQVDRRRAQQQESSRPNAAAAPLVDEAAKRLEQLRHALHLVQDHQLVFVSGQVEAGVGQPLAVRRILQVEIDARTLFGDELGQRGLACLAGAEQSHGRELVQAGTNELRFLTRNHPRNYGVQCHECKDR